MLTKCRVTIGGEKSCLAYLDRWSTFLSFVMPNLIDLGTCLLIVSSIPWDKRIIRALSARVPIRLVFRFWRPKESQGVNYSVEVGFPYIDVRNF